MRIVIPTTGRRMDHLKKEVRGVGWNVGFAVVGARDGVVVVVVPGATVVSSVLQA